jgi:hypothetical protein
MPYTFSEQLQEGIEGKYRLHVAWKFETVEFVGLPHLKEERPLTLEEIYVPLSLTWTQGSAERVFVPQALEEHRHLVVLGDPGSGKTTLVKLLAYSFGRLEPTPLARRLGARIPIPIVLREYKVRNWNSPEDMLADYVAQLGEEVRSEVTVEWLLAALEQGRGILLLDGLDEVGSKEDRQHLRDAVAAPLLARMRSSMAVMTSRIVGYEEVTFAGTLVLATVIDPRKAYNPPARKVVLADRTCFVTPFDESEIDQFVARWYSARERDPAERSRRIESLQAACKRNAQIRRLAGTPALLTLMALIHRVTADLPSGRVKLYDKIVEAYLETIQRYRGLGAYDASLEQMKRWLAKVGWEMQRRRSGASDEALFATREDVLGWLREAIEQDRPDGHGEAAQFLEYVARRSGLLIPRGPDQFAFAHLSFQEYFAAWSLRGKVWSPQDLAAEIGAVVAHRHWHETLILLFESLAEFQGAGDRLVGSLLESRHLAPEGSHEVVDFLAALAVDEQTGLSRGTRKAVVEAVLTDLARALSQSALEILRSTSSGSEQYLSTYSWIEQQAARATPDSIGDDFFLMGAQFDAFFESFYLAEVPSWLERRGHLDWTRLQVESIVAFGGLHPEVCAWSAARLSLDSWYRNSLLFLPPLAELARIGLARTRNKSVVCELLAQLGWASAVNCSLAFPLVSARAAGALDGDVGAFSSRHASDGDSGNIRPVRHSTFVLARIDELRCDLSNAEVAGWIASLKRSLMRQRVLTFALVPDRTRIPRTAVESICSFLGAPAPTPSVSALEPGDVVSALREVERAQAEPFVSGFNVDAISQALMTLASASDDWTRLLALMGLMAIGRGSRHHCEQLNELLDRGVREPSSFTFPWASQEVSISAQVREELPKILKHVFLHREGDPWIKPEWLDPSHPASRFFLAPPRKFWARAAEVLDPEGKTDLAKFRSPS